MLTVPDREDSRPPPGSNRTVQGVATTQVDLAILNLAAEATSSGSPGSEPRSSGKRTPLLPLSLEHARFPVRRQRKQPLKTSCFACPDESRAADAVAAHLRYAAESDAARECRASSQAACLRASLPNAREGGPTRHAKSQWCEKHKRARWVILQVRQVVGYLESLVPRGLLFTYEAGSWPQYGERDAGQALENAA
ncbi:hypothetical protein MTO96_013016 [Rhipicephalus appendiculatus]